MKTYPIVNLTTTTNSHRKLKEFYETKGYEDSRIALERWYDIAEKAEWKSRIPSIFYVIQFSYLFYLMQKYELILNYKIFPETHSFGTLV